MSVMIGEFLGTMFLIIFGDGVVATTLLAKSKGQHGGWISITTGWGLAVMMGVFIALAGGSHYADINPAVSLARYLLDHSYTLPQLLSIQLAQLLGALTGGVIVWLSYYAHWRETEDPLIKRLVFCTSPAIRNFPSNLLNEIIGTAVLIIGVGAIFGKNNLIAPGLGPYLVGMLVWGIGLSLGGPTGYAINPARDLGPRIAHAILPIPGKGTSDWSYAWIPVIGPFIGCIIGAIVWKIFLS